MQGRFNYNFNFVLASIKQSGSRLEGDCETATAVPSIVQHFVCVYFGAVCPLVPLAEQ